MAMEPKTQVAGCTIIVDGRVRINRNLFCTYFPIEEPQNSPFNRDTV